MREIRCGIDIGSVAAKMIVVIPGGFTSEITSAWSDLQHLTDQADAQIWGLQWPVLGEPISVTDGLLTHLMECLPPEGSLRLQLTGIHAKHLADHLNLTSVNEFKAIGYGAVALNPEVRTILEMGGDASRYLQVHCDAISQNITLLDYARNGDCAAGTGSFIDQQVARMGFEVSAVSDIVATAENTANIAGRCSVFAKSDMVHAQQRGYTPASILKGLCEAVVRNYTGTVLRGKRLQAPVMFLGGVAANKGVVAALREALAMDIEVPSLHAYAAALGCARLEGGILMTKERLHALRSLRRQRNEGESRRQRLALSGVHAVEERVRPEETLEVMTDVYLGIDVGSVSTNLVLLDREGRVLDEIYTRTEGKPLQVVQRELKGWQKKWASRVRVLGVGATGSGREISSELVGADTIQDEITAHKTGAAFIAANLGLKPVDTIFEIGGQDAKFIALEDGVVVDFAMNEACAAGTGSFLEEQACKMGISIVDAFAALAFAAEKPAAMGERCTVFMEKDVSALLQQGMAKEEIAAGLAFAVVQNYLNRVVRGRKIGETIFFQGGTAYNAAVAAAFAATLEKKIIVPPHCGVMGAIGAALLARTKMAAGGQSRFNGFDLASVQFSVRHFNCRGCSNQCDIQEVTVSGEKSYWGDKCSERYRRKTKTDRKAVIPDFFELHENLLLRDLSGVDGLNLKIGLPRAIYYYDRFPFWRAYFTALGAEVILSDSTNRQIVARGREYCISEPCFPILAAHGHVANLMEKEVDYIFLPNAINAETNWPETCSWYCPWGQTLPLVIKNTFHHSVWANRILAPVLHFREGRETVERALLPMARRIGVSDKINRQAVAAAYSAQTEFNRAIKEAGKEGILQLAAAQRHGILLLGRPYNLMDPGLNLNIASKLRENYGIDVIPMDFLSFEEMDARHIHENMFWNYGRRILQAAMFAREQKNLHAIYITNFKCGPDSYIKHWIHDALGSSYLTLQFDEHGNDAGIITRCEAYLRSKGLIQESAAVSEKVEENV